jgi:ceramide glucosyltransferase
VIVLLLLCGAAAAYQALAIFACLGHLRRRDSRSGSRPPVSILKPVYGADDHFLPAILSHASVAYPQFEIVFGVRDMADSAVPYIRQLQAQFPHVEVRIVVCTTVAPNGKVGSLVDLVREARHDVLVVNDSDILVPPDYLDVVTSALERPGVGLVTCLYRASASSFAAEWEALGIATDFGPSALVAPLVGVSEFGLGSTLAFRRADLEAIGGWEGIGDFIADDYQLGKRISRSGKKVVLTRMAVETHLGAATWQGVWQHQVRWARTIRASKGAYLGLPITNASLWALCAFAAGLGTIGFVLLGLRMMVAALAGGFVLRDCAFARLWWLVPFRDLWGFAVWCAGAINRPVIWRGKRMQLDDEGRIQPIE